MTRKRWLQLTQRGLRLGALEAELDKMRLVFERDHCLVVQKFLEGPLLRVLQRQIRRASFQPSNLSFGNDLRVQGIPAARVLQLLLNDHELFRIVQRLTGCRRIQSFRGDVRRATRGTGNSLGWHSDASPRRIVAITINLSEERYEGGALQIRDSPSRKIVASVTNAGAGDAVIFRIDPSLEHRNTSVISDEAKTSFSGWFMSGARFVDVKSGFFVRSRTDEGSTGQCELPRTSQTAWFRLSPHVVAYRTAPGAVLLDLDTAAGYGLDLVAARMVDLLCAGRTVGSVAGTIAREFDASKTIVRRDVAGLAARLSALGVLRPQ